MPDRTGFRSGACLLAAALGIAAMPSRRAAAQTAPVPAPPAAPAPPGQGQAPGTPIDWSADDAQRVADLVKTGARREGTHVVLFTPTGALPAADEAALLDRLDRGVAALRAVVGRHPWQVVTDQKITYYVCPDRFVSHASGRAAVFIPIARVLDGRAPFLHEAGHELLATFSRPVGAIDPERRAVILSSRPLWLSEGLADYVGQTAATKAGVTEGDVFALGGLAGADAACRDRIQLPRGPEVLPFIGAVGAPAALFTTERQQVAPIFYACGTSFTRHLVDRIGLDATIELMPHVLAGTAIARIEAAAGVPMETIRAEWRTAIGLTGAVAAPAATLRVDAAALSKTIEARLAEQRDGAAASVWLGGATGDAWLARDPATPRPTASAIKTFYLVELFAAHAGHLDDPLDSAAVLADDAHPAIGHFTPEQRADIRRELGGAAVRRVAQVMMGSAPASNAVYNAAANLITAALGGPEALTARIHRRDPAFAGVAVRRYMLRDRKEHGDNEATAGALATLWQQIASKQVAGVDAATTEAIRAAILRDTTSAVPHFLKNGVLDSDPMAEVRAGAYETASGPIVYVVMTTQPVPGADGRDATSQRLAATATAIRDALVAAATAAAPGR